MIRGVSWALASCTTRSSDEHTKTMNVNMAPASDLDRWVAVGAAGWAWTDVADLYQQAMDDRLPLRVCTLASTELTSLHDAVLATAPQVGIDLDRTIDQGLAVRVGADGRWRRSSAVDYLPSTGDRATLVVRGDTVVDRVVMEGRRAVGVALEDGEAIEAGEVVLSAGALRTPGLLLRSGVQRRAIGRNLVDHPAVTFVLEWRSEHGRESVSSPNRLLVTGVVPFGSGYGDGDSDGTADLQLLALSRLGNDDVGRRYGAVLVALMDVRSRGSVTSPSSSGGGSDVVIDPHSLADDADRRRLRVGVRRTLALLRQPAITAVTMGVFVDDHGTPAAATAELDDEALDEWMRVSLGGYAHAAGTCRMGAVDDPDAVCDSEGRVIGYDGLRVVDASLFPDLPRVGPMLTCVVLAEHVARRWDVGDQRARNAR